MSQPKLSVETQTSIYNCLCMLLLDCFRGTKYSMYENHAPPPHMLLCEFHHPPISLYIIKNSNFSFKPTLSNNHVQTILFAEAQLETISFFLPGLGRRGSERTGSATAGGAASRGCWTEKLSPSPHGLLAQILPCQGAGNASKISVRLL